MHRGLKIKSDRAQMEAATDHSKELMRFLRNRVGSVDDASDLHQETFVRLARGSSAPIADLRAYLFRVARNLSEDFLRSERRRRGRFVDELKDDIASDQPNPEQIVLGMDQMRELRAALASLPERQRLALLLYRLEGMPLREIGVRLKVSESMASRYVAKALRHCALRLGR
jgi:RNA polymerase sigma factor (sigma-70 family)